MPLQGDLATLPVRELLEMLTRTRATGRLSVTRGMAARRFHLDAGKVVLSSSSEPESLLGRLLVDRGLIEEAGLDRALAPRKGARADALLRLGETLADAGLISRDALAEVLAEKTERMLLDTLGWRDGQFYFEEALQVAPATAAPVDLGALLGQGRGRDILPVNDADVLEVSPLAGPVRKPPGSGPAPSRAMAPAPTRPLGEGRTRRRKRGDAVA